MQRTFLVAFGLLSISFITVQAEQDTAVQRPPNKLELDQCTSDCTGIVDGLSEEKEPDPKLLLLVQKTAYEIIGLKCMNEMIDSQEECENVHLEPLHYRTVPTKGGGGTNFLVKLRASDNWVAHVKIFEGYMRKTPTVAVIGIETKSDADPLTYIF